MWSLFILCLECAPGIWMVLRVFLLKHSLPVLCTIPASQFHDGLCKLKLGSQRWPSVWLWLGFLWDPRLYPTLPYSKKICWILLPELLFLLLPKFNITSPRQSPFHDHKLSQNFEWTAKYARYALLAHHFWLKCLCYKSIAVWMCCMTCLAEKHSQFTVHLSSDESCKCSNKNSLAGGCKCLRSNLK